MIDPRSQLVNSESNNEAKQLAINFCSILPELFSEDFDRKSMWTRIGNGIVSACKKCGGDYEVFVNLALDFVKAEPGRMASNTRLEEWLLIMEGKEAEEQKIFLHTLEHKSSIILVYSRQLWNSLKGAAK